MAQLHLNMSLRLWVHKTLTNLDISKHGALHPKDAKYLGFLRLWVHPKGATNLRFSEVALHPLGAKKLTISYGVLHPLCCMKCEVL